MLRSFAVKNFKQFKDWITLDLAQKKQYEFNPQGIRNGLVNKALIYGYNGIGKSNFALALMDIVLHLTDKTKRLELYSNYLNGYSKADAMAEFAYSFQFNTHHLTYSYGKRDFEHIIYESVTINGKEIIAYNRLKKQPLRIDLPGTETLNKNLDQIKISVLKYIKANAVLTTSQESVILKEFFDFVDTMLLFWHLDTRNYQGYTIGSADIFTGIIEDNHFKAFKQFLKDTQLDSNIVCDREDDTYIPYFQFKGNKITYWGNASTGMRAVTLFYYWFQQIKYGTNPPSFVLIDEFDAFYHIALSRSLIKELKTIETCQIMLTTHDTSLLTNDLLRPDCYFIMDKDGISSLAERTDKELRYAHNLEKIYRAGISHD